MEKRYAGCANLSEERIKRLEQLRNSQSDESKERELLHIRPLVKRADRAFVVKYEPISEFIKEFEIDDYLLVTTPGVFKTIYEQLSGTYKVVYTKTSRIDELENLPAMFKETTESMHVDKGLTEQQRCINDGTVIDSYKFQAVVCMGGGVAMDAGKYIAEKVGAPLYAIPTVLSVNAAFCYKAAVREPDQFEKGRYNVVYRFYGLPQAICIDLDVITNAKDFEIITGSANKEEKDAARIRWNMLRELNIAGAGDLLSILTATYDWKLNSIAARGLKVDGSEQYGMVSLEKPFSQEVCDGANEVLDMLGEYATEIRSGSREGAEFLARAYHWIAEQSWIMQHTMWESASEHGMFDCFENVAGTELTHGQVVALSVFFMSLLQDNQHERAVKMIQRLGIDISLAYLCAIDDNNYMIQPSTLCKCLAKLKEYIEQIDYRYTIISARPITEDWILKSIDYYYNTVYGDLIDQYERRSKLYPELKQGDRSDQEEINASERLRLEKIHDKLVSDLSKHREAFESCQKSYEAANERRVNIEKILANPKGRFMYKPSSEKQEIVDLYKESLSDYLKCLEHLEK